MSSVRHKLKEKIEELSYDQQLEVFRIIHDNNIEYSENANGVFINLSTLDTKIVRKINKHIKYCKDKQKELCKTTQEMDKLRREMGDCLEETDETAPIKDDGFVPIETVYTNTSYRINNLAEEDDCIEGYEGDITKSTNINKSKLNDLLKQEKKSFSVTKSKIIKNFKQNTVGSSRIIGKRSKVVKTEDDGYDIENNEDPEVDVDDDNNDIVDVEDEDDEEEED